MLTYRLFEFPVASQAFMFTPDFKTGLPVRRVRALYCILAYSKMSYFAEHNTTLYNYSHFSLAPVYHFVIRVMHSQMDAFLKVDIKVNVWINTVEGCLIYWSYIIIGGIHATMLI